MFELNQTIAADDYCEQLYRLKSLETIALLDSPLSPGQRATAHGKTDVAEIGATWLGKDE